MVHRDAGYRLPAVMSGHQLAELHQSLSADAASTETTMTWTSFRAEQFYMDEAISEALCSAVQAGDNGFIAMRASSLDAAGRSIYCYTLVCRSRWYGHVD